MKATLLVLFLVLAAFGSTVSVYAGSDCEDDLMERFRQLELKEAGIVQPPAMVKPLVVQHNLKTNTSISPRTREYNRLKAKEEKSILSLTEEEITFISEYETDLEFGTISESLQDTLIEENSELANLAKRK